MDSQPLKNFVYMDKKRFTEEGEALLLQGNKNSDKLGNIKVFKVDETSIYRGQFEITALVDPDCIVVSLPDDKSAKRDEQRTELLVKLATDWRKEVNKPFDMTVQFPGRGSHVIARLNMTSVLDQEFVLLDRALNRKKGSVEAEFIYLRAYILDVKARCDVLSASYILFLYDYGILAPVPLESIRPMSDEQRELYTPVHRILHMSGLSPLAKQVVLASLHEKPSYKLKKVDTWPSTTKSIVFEVLRSYALKLMLFAVYGVELYGDIKMVKCEDTEEVAENMFLDPGKYELYTAYLVQQELAVINHDVLYSTLMLNAEDEESIDWVAEVDHLYSIFHRN